MVFLASNDAEKNNILPVLTSEDAAMIMVVQPLDTIRSGKEVSIPCLDKNIF